MQRPRSSVFFLGLLAGAVGLTGLIACSSDDDDTSDEMTPSNRNSDSGSSVPPDSGTPSSPDACTGPALPPVTDYGARGPFEVTRVDNTGPSNQYTMFRPTALGENGFKHPPTSWGNGVTTTPDLYVELLSTVASHGFVVIASNSTSMTAELVRQGLDWLIEQNATPGDLEGTLAVECGVTIGYSMGGGSAVGAGTHPNVVATVSLHGLMGPANDLSGPLLLVTSTDDGFVTKQQFVEPTYAVSNTVPTIMATLERPDAPSFNGHLIPLNDAGPERAPLVAWLRYWVYGDEGAKSWFFGDDCVLCMSPWTEIQRKNYDW